MSSQRATEGSSETPPASPSVTDRVIELESLFLHLQRTVHELDGVVRSQQATLDELQLRADRLEWRLRVVQEQQREAEPRRLEDDRPPHY